MTVSPPPSLKLPTPRKPRTSLAPAVPPKPTLNPLPFPLATTISYSTPVRRILTPEDLTIFQSSSTYTLLLNFVLSLNQAALDKQTITVSIASESGVITAILRVLKRVERLLEENPRVDNGGSRFGNQGFKDFYDALEKEGRSVHEDMGLGLNEGAIDELSTYLSESFGNRTRIDYGSGHELNFLCWLLCLHQLSLLKPENFPAISLLVFPTYITLMRQIQQTYYLEPAGSHGVWGLDDYHFLPFLLGSSQLFHHPHLRPSSIHNGDVLEEFGDRYMYLDCIRFIISVKTTAGLRWHSPMLDDISGAKSWGKVNVGMAKMWEVEVLGKLPVMQHFLFGGILGAPEGISAASLGLSDEDGVGADEDHHHTHGDVDDEEVEDISGKSAEEVRSLMGRLDREGMRHVHSSWGECCGIKVPTAFAARDAEQQKGGGLRNVGRLPFD